MSKPLIIFLVLLAALLFFLNAEFPYALSGAGDQARLIYLLILLGFIGSGVLAANRRNLSHTVQQALIWLVIILALVIGYSFKDRLMGELVPNRVTLTGVGEMQLRAREDGHFYVEAQVNGQPVNFMIDTGASDVVLSKQDAARVGLDPDTLSYTRMYSTANGMVGGASVRLNSLQIGNQQLTDFPASVNGGALESSLLGMRALIALGGIRIEGSTLIIGSKQP